jgi:hypothetical protein
VIAGAVYFAAAGLVFVVLYGARSAWRNSWTGRNLMAFSAGVAALVVGLLFEAAHHPVSIWIWAVIIYELCYAMTERVWLLWRAQQKERYGQDR